MGPAHPSGGGTIGNEQQEAAGRHPLYSEAAHQAAALASAHLGV